MLVASIGDSIISCSQISSSSFLKSAALGGSDGVSAENPLLDRSSNIKKANALRRITEVGDGELLAAVSVNLLNKLMFRSTEKVVGIGKGLVTRSCPHGSYYAGQFVSSIAIHGFPNHGKDDVSREFWSFTLKSGCDHQKKVPIPIKN